MGINRPSLYAAFGNKEALFRKALARYTSGPACYITRAMEEPTARKMLERLFSGLIDMLTCPTNPSGCMVVQSALASGDAAESIRRDLAMVRAAGETMIRRRLERAVAEGDLPATADAAELARYLAVVVHGMAVRATAGASRRDLEEVADIVLRTWPP
jgi:AcrR family transcriptional regulator